MTRYPVQTVILWFTALIASLVAGVALGSEHLTLSELYTALLAGPARPEDVGGQILWRLRLPRVMLAFLTGGGLAVCGVAMQALVRNPLAEPYILGISSGASVGASLFYLGFLPPVISIGFSMPFSAFLGGLIAILLVYAVAYSATSISITRLLLSGVAVSAMMSAVTAFVTLASPDPNKTRAVLFWLLGSFANAYWQVLIVPSIATFIGLLVLLLFHRHMDALLLGEEPAQSLGFSVERLKRLLIVVTALVAGTLVSVSGTIGFVGLVIPHSVRSMVGVSHRRVIPVSFAAGAVFMIWADLAARTILPSTELPVGILTAICGVPFFLVLLRRSQYRFGS